MINRQDEEEKEDGKKQKSFRSSCLNIKQVSDVANITWDGTKLIKSQAEGEPRTDGRWPMEDIPRHRDPRRRWPIRIDG